MMNIKERRIFEYSKQENKWDEFYTSKEEVEHIFTDVIQRDYLIDKVIYCPCDSEQSEFVRYLKTHKDDIKYRQFIYTGDDFHTHEDIFENADVIITNPPFTHKLFNDLMKIIKKYDKKCFLFNSVAKSHFKFKYDMDVQVALKFNFNTPIKMNLTNDYYIFVRHIYLYNIPCNVVCPSPKFKLYFKDIDPVYNYRKDGSKILNIDRIDRTPQDYDGPMLLPVTVCQEHNARFFDFLENKTYDGGLGYSDNRGRFLRVLVKWKEKYLKKQDG